MDRFRGESDWGPRALIYGAMFALGGLGLWGCGAMTEGQYSAAEAQGYVEDSGYLNVEYIGTDTFLLGVEGCDRNDTLRYEFSATAANGREVEVLVCKGLFKGATIRQG